MNQSAAVAAVCGGYLRPIEIACAAVFCGGSAAVCGGFKKASEINVRRFAAVGMEVTPIPLYASRRPWSAPASEGRGDIREAGAAPELHLFGNPLLPSLPIRARSGCCLRLRLP
jgi:hypothetical protein